MNFTPLLRTPHALDDPRSSGQGVTGFIQAVKYALQGWWEMRTHSNFMRQLVLAVLAVGFGVTFGLTSSEWAILFLTIGLVLCAEMGNSAIEETVNLMTREHRKEAKFAKDFAAGMVLLASVIAIIVGLFLFGPKLLAAIRYSLFAIRS